MRLHDLWTSERTGDGFDKKRFALSSHSREWARVRQVLLRSLPNCHGALDQVAYSDVRVSWQQSECVNYGKCHIEQ